MELLKTKTTPKQSPNSSFLCLKLPYYNPKKEITFLYKTIFPSQTFNNLKLHKTNSNSFSSTGIDFSNEHLKKCMEYQTNNSINIETPSIEPEIDEEEKFEAIKPKYHQNSITPVLTPRLPLNHNNTSTNHKGNNIPIGSCTSRIMKTITNFHKQTLNNADLNIVNYQLDKKSYLDEESNYNKYLNLYKQYNKEKLNKIKISNTNKLFYDVFFGNKSNTKYKEGFNDELIISNKLNKSC